MAETAVTSENQNRQGQQKVQILSPGTKAPDFCLKTTPDQMIGLKDFEGKPLVLVFYPADWSPVCEDELDVFNQSLEEIERYGAAVVGISVDNVWSHIAYSKAHKLKFPIASDFEPKGKTAQDFKVYQTKEGVCHRAIFLIDEEGIIRWSYLSPPGMNPGAAGVIKALKELRQAKPQQGAA